MLVCAGISRQIPFQKPINIFYISKKFGTEALINQAKMHTMYNGQLKPDEKNKAHYSKLSFMILIFG